MRRVPGSSFFDNRRDGIELLRARVERVSPLARILQSNDHLALPTQDADGFAEPRSIERGNASRKTRDKIDSASSGAFGV